MDPLKSTEQIKISASWERFPSRKLPAVVVSPPTLWEEIQDGLERAQSLWGQQRRQHPWLIPLSVFLTGCLLLVGVLTLIPRDSARSSYLEAPQSLASHRRSRGGSEIDRESIRQSIRTTARDSLKEPTRGETFQARWDVLKVYIGSLPRRERLKHFPPEVMAELRVAFYRSPEGAAPRLDELLAQAGRLNELQN